MKIFTRRRVIRAAHFLNPEPARYSGLQWRKFSPHQHSASPVKAQTYPACGLLRPVLNRTYSAEIICVRAQSPPASSHISLRPRKHNTPTRSGTRILYHTRSGIATVFSNFFRNLRRLFSQSILSPPTHTETCKKHRKNFLIKNDTHPGVPHNGFISATSNILTIYMLKVKKRKNKKSEKMYLNTDMYPFFWTPSFELNN